MSHHREEKDGHIPTWDGTPEKWDTYVIKVGVHLKTEPKWKLSQTIAKLISRLTSKAWELVEQTEESSLDALTTKELYLAFLKKNLLASAVPELGRHFRKWYAFRRLKSESMKLYVMRHRKMLIDLEKAMSLVDNGAEIKLQLADLVTKARLKCLRGRSSNQKTSDKEASERSHRSAKAGTTKPSSSSNSAEKKPKVWKRRTPVQEEPAEEDENEEEYEEDHPAFAGDNAYSDNDDQTSAKRAKTRDHGDWDWENWKWDYDEGKWVERNDEIPKNKLELLAHYLGKLSQEAGMTDDLEKIIEIISQTWRSSPLPDLLTGWNLLQKSGLSAQERATILAASSMSVGNTSSKLGAIKLALIEQALQTQWQDEELKERDDRGERRGEKKGTGFNRRAYGAEGSDIDEASDSGKGSEHEGHTALDSEEQSGDEEQDGLLLADMSDSEERETFFF